MRLGVGSYTWPWAVGVEGYPPPRPLSAFDLLARASALDVQVLQLCDNIPWVNMSKADARRLVVEAEALRVSLQFGTRGCQPAHLRRQISLCAEMGARLLRVVLDQGNDQPTPDEAEHRLRGLLPELERAGITLAIENHDRFQAEELSQLIERLASPRIGICLDTVNSFAALEVTETVLRSLARFTVNLHVKDFVIRRQPHQLGFIIEGAPAGAGRLNLPKLFQALSPGVDAIVEQWPPPGACLAESIAREAAWAELSISFLKKILHGEPS